MKPQIRNAALVAALALFPLAVLAQDHSHAHVATTPSAASATMTQGDVRKVDAREGILTLRHGPLDNLGMPAMTMMFRVKDPAMLSKVKQGDKVRFVADNVKGELTVVQMELQR
jgi:Cu(I)/Ag(I) efflux system periplasmic protein CusF